MNTEKLEHISTSPRRLEVQHSSFLDDSKFPRVLRRKAIMEMKTKARLLKCHIREGDGRIKGEEDRPNRMENEIRERGRETEAHI